MPLFDASCQRCGMPLEQGVRADAKWCSVRCQVAAHRDRRRVRSETLARYDHGRQSEEVRELPQFTLEPRVNAVTLVDDDDVAIAMPFDAFDMDPEPWPGFNGSVGLQSRDHPR